MTEALIRKCPKCSEPYVKDDGEFALVSLVLQTSLTISLAGCNKISCPSCRTISCYICMKIVRPSALGFVGRC